MDVSPAALVQAKALLTIESIPTAWTTIGMDSKLGTNMINARARSMLRDLYVVVTSTQRQMVLELSEELGINIHDTEEEERSSMILPDVSKGPIRFYIPHGEWSIARDGALYKGRPVHIEEETGLYYVNVSKSLSTDMLDAVTSPLNIGIGDNFGKPKSDKRKALEAMLTSEEMLALQWALIDIRAATTDEYIKKRVLKIYELLGVQTS